MSHNDRRRRASQEARSDSSAPSLGARALLPASSPLHFPWSSTSHTPTIPSHDCNALPLLQQSQSISLTLHSSLSPMLEFDRTEEGREGLQERHILQGYNLERALDYFFNNRNKYPPSSSSSPSSSSKVDPARLNRLFDSYADAEEKDTMSGENLARFFTDIAIDPSSMLTLAVAWQMHCHAFGEIGRKEWVTHYTGLGMDNLEKIKANAATLQATMKDPTQYKAFYRWLFEFVKEEGERKTIDADAAVEMWVLVLGQWALCKEWLKFVESQKLKVVSHDLWMQLFDFSKDVGEDLKGYDQDGAWPVIIDDFVAALRARKESATAKPVKK